MDKRQLIDGWAGALERGNGALFVGAGLSTAAGYPSWRELLRDIARDIQLDIEIEHDLAAVAQYYLNKEANRRGPLSGAVTRHFPNKQPPAVMRILARLPVRTVWTTNYDTLIEQAWQYNGKDLQVMSTQGDLSVDNAWTYGKLYKMHGSVTHPHEIVIAKDDYELYRRRRDGFIRSLGDLIGKRFLFLGFSFSDPNITHLFGTIRETFQAEVPQHFTIVRRPPRGRSKKAKYESVRHDLWVADLKRYGIDAVEVEDYSDIDKILLLVEKRIARRSVFVAGSYPETSEGGSDGERGRIAETAREIGSAIVKADKRLVSGFGLTVGSSTISGALGVLLENPLRVLDKSLMLRPFPREAPQGMRDKEYKRLYREDMVQMSGICVFVAGAKLNDGGEMIVADGVIAEFEAAKKFGRLLIPVGSTGYAAKQVWEAVERDFDVMWTHMPRSLFERLNDDALSPSEIGAVVLEIMKKFDKQG